VPKSAGRRKPNSKITAVRPSREVPAGEFKAKCLALLDEVNETGQELIITKRGKPTAKLIPFRPLTKRSFIGRLEGIMKINGDPDDLIKPVFPEEDWDMLK
jgi:prevent-host-death family protein